MIRQGRHAERSLIDLARVNRSGQTCAEEALWKHLRHRRFLNLKFRRQHQIGRYIVDFFCAELNLIIELDGPVHLDTRQADRDVQRTLTLQRTGATVLRFTNDQLLGSEELVLERIERIAYALRR
jgi:very-short-patch-repair endonuclease